MLKADLHVHSIYSEHPTDWFLQRLGSKESYTEPDKIFEECIAKNMDLVTITDHNRIDGALLLKAKYPDKVFVSVESTAYFPEDHCKVHILIYDISTEQFAVIQQLRENIYELRDFLIDQDISHSVAHATYSVNGKLTPLHLEKLILMFNVFEGINGARDIHGNTGWQNLLKGLTPQILAELQNKHGIIPSGETPWIKGFTGGSDDHSGFFIGNTFTVSGATDIKGFVNSISNCETFAEGRHNDFTGLTFSIYKIAIDYLKTGKDLITGSMFGTMNSMIFDNLTPTFMDKFKLSRVKKAFKKKKDIVKLMAIEAIEEFNKKKDLLNSEDRIHLLYERIADISDELTASFFQSISKETRKGKLSKIFKRLSGTLIAAFLSVPFITTIKHLNQNRNMANDLGVSLGIKPQNKTNKVLWFTDTIDDLNGVSVTLRNIGWHTHRNGIDLSIVTSHSNKEGIKMPPNTINLKSIYEFDMPYYEHIKLKIPSLLNTIKLITTINPDEIVISTPGPIGLTGLLLAKLLNIPSKGIYHTDFAGQSESIVKDGTLFTMIDTYLKWFYNLFDAIKVPSRNYIDILHDRGYNTKSMSVFNRGINFEQFNPGNISSSIIRKHYKAFAADKIKLLYTGRVSKDKNMDFLLEIFIKLNKSFKNLHLIIAGDGPYLDELKSGFTDDNIFFIGKITQEDLPSVYSNSDLFVFPSNIDTFGMSVLEAQSCSLPCVVSDIGGPKEIIIDGETGFVCKANDLENWSDRLSSLITMIERRSHDYNSYKLMARNNVVNNYNWNSLLN